jgi:outer membrane cobalamin receptor
LSDRWRFSPLAALSVQPIERWPFSLRISYRNNYRLPTLSDIYYSALPNWNLQPENANQYNLGGVFVASAGVWLPRLSFSADVYCNRVENKIVAVPLSSLALWSVQNYGNTRGKGVDLNAMAHIRFTSGFSAEIGGNYTRQEVLNENGQWLRYTPRRFASALAGLKTPWCDLNYSLIYCGNRYFNETPSLESLVADYADHGFSISRSFLLSRGFRLHLSADCLNFTNQSYEVVHAYPMPGRSFRFGLKIIY